MMFFGAFLSVLGIGFFCWLLFTLAVYALPFFVGLSAGIASFHSGAGLLGAIVVTLLCGAATLAAGQILFATVRTPLYRGLIALLYAAPAAVAGYHATLGLAQIGGSSNGWPQAFALIGGVCVGVTAWGRMAVFVPMDQGQVSGALLPLPSPGGTRSHWAPPSA